MGQMYDLGSFATADAARPASVLFMVARATKDHARVLEAQTECLAMSARHLALLDTPTDGAASGLRAEDNVPNVVSPSPPPAAAPSASTDCLSTADNSSQHLAPQQQH